MLRQSLLKLSRNGRVQGLVENAPITPELVSRFVAGTDRDELVAVAADLAGKGLLTIVDHLGEDAATLEVARAITDEYHSLLTSLAEAGLTESAEIAVKLSALGLGLTGGQQIALDHARELCRAAAEVGTKVTIDMEDHTTTDATLEVVRELRRDHPETGLVLQAYLKRTEDDCREFAVEGARVRLCKGAYARVPGLSFADDHEIDLAFVRCLRVLMEGDGYPMVATHDPRMIGITQGMARMLERSRDSFEFQMLHGIRPLEQRRLVDIGYRSRVYLPYGTQWYEYFVRRVAEKPATVALIGRSLLSRR
ncbi:proline dehydrogenase family protein [Aestuariimicrobium ganziense]|uniref:proline dehydrogenase family protein n=1 Tax=Aestuariimicrobium ganziense TaxID=2773677 RepID=UPI0019453560|nr:proline dehydrogenase family protein [Aestuariimicrobium ganziense]